MNTTIDLSALFTYHGTLECAQKMIVLSNIQDALVDAQEAMGGRLIDLSNVIEQISREIDKGDAYIAERDDIDSVYMQVLGRE